MFINCHTYYSLRYGTLSLKDLLTQAQELGIKKMALTDINSTSVVMDFVKSSSEFGIFPVVGIEFRDSNGRLLWIGLARDNNGFYELNKFFSQCSDSQEEVPVYAPKIPCTYIIYPFQYDFARQLEHNEYIGIRPSEVSKIISSPVRYMHHKAVVLQPVSLAGPQDHKLHCLLRAIDQNRLLANLDHDTLADPHDHFLPEDHLVKHFTNYPKIVENTKRLLNNCSIKMDPAPSKNRKSFTGSAVDDRHLLEKLAKDGFSKRYPQDNPEAGGRLEQELSVIDQQGFCPYFLITHDIIRYARDRGFAFIGRGSGANSLVAYCIGITNVDPIALDLYFERFINPSRTSPPDFDIDFSWDERDEVIDYIFKRYANEHVALLATYNTFQWKAIIRELGKAYGLPPSEIKSIGEGRLGINEEHDHIIKEILYYGQQLKDFPNYLSIHAGGILITEASLYNYSIRQMTPKGFPIVHFDMYTAEEHGFYKYDILAQRGLGHIRDTVRIVRQNQGKQLDIDQLQQIMQDQNVNEMIRKAKTIGVFYIESPAMRGLLCKLKCDRFDILVAASSIIRPGVSSSGMMQEYIRRHHEPDKVSYIHPVFKQHLGDTYGVMVYQEDVLKIAHHFAGLDLAEADILRRAMSGKFRSKAEFQRLHDKFFSNCREQGYEESLIAEVWRQMESFAGYSFCKAHSASYAVESYQSLYLKTYFPLEFMVGVINNSGGFYSKEVYVHEARMAGGEIEEPCVQHGHFNTSIKGKTIYLGLCMIKGLEQKVVYRIVEERDSNGDYQSINDFVRRTAIGKEQFQLLVQSNALRFTGVEKPRLLWKSGTTEYLSSVNGLSSLPFQLVEEPTELPSLDVHEMDNVFDQIELMGFPLISPFKLLVTDFRGDVMANELSAQVGKVIKMVGYFVARKNVRTKHMKLMNFGTWLDVEGDFFDTVHFPQVLEKHPFTGPGCYLIQGKVVSEFGFPSLEVQKMAKLQIIEDPRYV